MRSIRDLLTHRAFRNTCIFSASTVFVNVGLYVYQLVAGRLLAVEDYGLLNSYIALYSMVALPSLAVGFFAVRYISLAYERHGEDGAAHLSGFLLGRMHRIFAVPYGLLLLASPLIARIFHLESVVLTGTTIVTAYAMTYLNFFRSIPYAKKDFLPFALNTSLELPIRIMVSVGCILLGYGVFGGFVGFPVGIGVSLVVLFAFQRNSLPLASDGSDAYTLDIPDMRRYLLPTLLLTGTVVLLSTIDMLIAKVSLSAADLGIYASAMMLGRIITFSLGMFVGVATPYFVDGRRYARFLAVVYGGLVGSGIIFLILYTLVPDLLIHLLFGARYDRAMAILPQVGVVSVAYSILTFIVTHRIIAGHRRYAYVAITFPIIIGSLLMGFHPHTLTAFLTVFAEGYGACAVVLAGAMIGEWL